MVTRTAKMDIRVKRFEELSPWELEDLFRLRQQVFIIEQQCFYEDIDGEDEQAEHVLMYESNTLAAYLRLFQPGVKFEDQASIGRIIVAKKFRGTGLGEKLINKGIELCKGRPIRIEAQAALSDYYRNLGFVTEGKAYPVDDILHIQMVLF